MFASGPILVGLAALLVLAVIIVAYLYLSGPATHHGKRKKKKKTKNRGRRRRRGGGGLCILETGQIVPSLAFSIANDPVQFETCDNNDVDGDILQPTIPGSGKYGWQTINVNIENEIDEDTKILLLIVSSLCFQTSADDEEIETESNRQTAALFFIDDSDGNEIHTVASFQPVVGTQEFIQLTLHPFVWSPPCCGHFEIRFQARGTETALILPGSFLCIAIL